MPRETKSDRANERKESIYFHSEHISLTFWQWLLLIHNQISLVLLAYNGICRKFISITHTHTRKREKKCSHIENERIIIVRAMVANELSAKFSFCRVRIQQQQQLRRQQFKNGKNGKCGCLLALCLQSAHLIVGYVLSFSFHAISAIIFVLHSGYGVVHIACSQ